MVNRPNDDPGEIPLSWFVRTLAPFKGVFIELLFVTFCIRVLGLVEPFIFQVVIDRVIPFESKNSLFVIVSVFIIATIFHLIFSVIGEILGTKTANLVTQDLGDRIFSHTLALPINYFRRWSVGDIISRVNETGTIRNFLILTTTGIALDILFVAIYIVILYAISPSLTYVVMLFVPVQIAIYMGLGPSIRARLNDQFEADARLQTQLVEGLGGVLAVKAFALEKSLSAKLSMALRSALNTRYSVAIVGLWHDKLLFSVDRLTTTCIILLGAQLVFSNQMTLGELIAFHLIAEKVAGPIANFSGFWESWQNVRISRRRLGDLINSPIEQREDLMTLPTDIEGELEFKNVRFEYISSAPVLSDFNFRAKPRTLSIVTGASGAGKSTFGRLACGIEVPSAGNVYIDGHDIAAYDPLDVRWRIVYVPQDPYLFSGTILENLVLGIPQVDASALEKALNASGAIELIAELPAGFETQVGERGSALSGGQRQRIALARALLRDPKVIILDEPTSALDEETRSRVISALQSLRLRSTVVVITHNPEFFHAADQVVEFGTR